MQLDVVAVLYASTSPPEWWGGVWQGLCSCIIGLCRCRDWCFSGLPDDDCTFLSVIFALNASFASVESITKSYMESMRAKFRVRMAKYNDPKWRAEAEGDESETSANKRAQLSEMTSKVLDIEKEIPDLFTKRTRFWKIVMGICAIVTLVCMVVPYTGRILVLLGLPVLLFIWRCDREAKDFDEKTLAACKEIDAMHERIRNDGHAAPSAENVNILSRLANIEGTLATIAKTTMSPTTLPQSVQKPTATKPRRRATKRK